MAVYRYQDRDLTMLGSEDYTQLAIGDYNLGASSRSSGVAGMGE